MAPISISCAIEITIRGTTSYDGVYVEDTESGQNGYPIYKLENSDNTYYLYYHTDSNKWVVHTSSTESDWPTRILETIDSNVGCPDQFGELQTVSGDTLTPIEGSAMTEGNALAANSDSDDDEFPRWIVVVVAVGFVATIVGLYKAAPIGSKRA